MVLPGVARTAEHTIPHTKVCRFEGMSCSMARCAAAGDQQIADVKRRRGVFGNERELGTSSELLRRLALKPNLPQFRLRFRLDS